MKRILAFFARRVVAAVFTLVAMIAITFVIFWAIPTSPALFVYPYAQHLTDFQIHQANHIFGLDQPKIEQFGRYLGHLVRGDFGSSWQGTTIDGNQHVQAIPIAPQLFAATRITFSILIGGALLVVVLALPLGAIAARYQGRLLDRAISFVTLVAICTHPMVLGLILRTFFGNRLDWLPAGGYCTFVHHPPIPPKAGDFGPGLGGPSCGGITAWADHLVLPWISFALLFLALYTRMSRASVLEVLHEDFVRTVRAKGASEKRVIGIHVMPNAGMRVLTMIGMEIGTAIGVCVYIESAFGMFGLGRYAVNAFSGSFALDRPVILAIVTMVTLIVIVGNLVVDLLYAVVDPRVGGGTRIRRAEVTEAAVV